MQEGWAGPLGMYTMFTYVDPRRLIKGIILKKGGMNHERES